MGKGLRQCAEAASHFGILVFDNSKLVCYGRNNLKLYAAALIFEHVIKFLKVMLLPLVTRTCFWEGTHYHGDVEHTTHWLKQLFQGSYKLF